MVNETKKILRRPDLAVSATCVRVPVPNCHGVAVWAELMRPFEIEEIVGCMAKQRGVRIEQLPLGTAADGGDAVIAGRIRRDLAAENGVAFFAVGDNLRKGAAANAVQIAAGILKC